MLRHEPPLGACMPFSGTKTDGTCFKGPLDRGQKYQAPFEEACVSGPMQLLLSVDAC